MPMDHSNDSDYSSITDEDLYSSSASTQPRKRQRKELRNSRSLLLSTETVDKIKRRTRVGRASTRIPIHRRRSTATLRSDTPSSTTESQSSDLSDNIITVCDVDLRPTVAFDTFWRFAAERKAIDDRRRAGQPAPWTEDPILRDYFFCNTYRVLDKVTQYFISEVVEKGSQHPEEVAFRVLLFNSFTKIDTWELLRTHLGPLKWATYNRKKYMKVLQEATNAGQSLYTSAFIKPAPSFGYPHNYGNHLCLIESFMENELSGRLLNAKYLADVYEYIISYPSMGQFSAYQLMLCFSYTKLLNFHYNDFVISGPGSSSGLNKIFGHKSMQHGRSKVIDFEAEVMRHMAENQDYYFDRLGIQFPGLGRKYLPMGIADIEHTLCEVDKYCRIAHPQLKGKRTHITRLFRSESSSTLPSKAILPKAWSHPDRKVPRIRENKAYVIEKRYVVRYVADQRDSPQGKQYLVYWHGYPDSEASWEFESSLLDDAPNVIREYLADLNSAKYR